MKEGNKRVNNNCDNQVSPNLKEGTWQVEDHTLCEECSEELFFKMKDMFPDCQILGGFKSDKRFLQKLYRIKERKKICR